MHRCFAFLFAATVATAGPVIVPVEGQPVFSCRLAGLSELSGLSWARGDLYYAVSDSRPGLIPLRLTIDPASGRLTAVRAEPTVAVRSPLTDFEDIACDYSKGRLFVSTERPPAVAIYSLPGQLLELLPLPPVFQQARSNKGLEALARNAVTGRLWTINEDTLTPDGPPSSGAAGGMMRLQEFDAKGHPARQFVWRSDPGGSGVTALCVLPTGELVVMERVRAGVRLEARLYLADFRGAGDTSRAPSLARAGVAPVQKTLLYKRSDGLTNYEGMAAGPVLSNGSRSLILVADNGSGDIHTFVALRLRLQ